MPSKTIYVSDDDLSLFQRAQELAGGNLSSAIAKALRRYVQVQEAQMEGFSEITVRVGKAGAQRRKSFTGRRIARWRHQLGDSRRVELFTVYRTAKGRFAVHVRHLPNWGFWSDPENWVEPSIWQSLREAGGLAGNWDWSTWWSPGDAELHVHETLEELRKHIPPELAEIVDGTVEESPVERLDI